MCRLISEHTWAGSFRDTVSAKQPIVGTDEIIADLHAHPYISSLEDFYKTLDVLVENNERLNYEDKDSIFQLTYNGKRLTFIPGYEMYVLVDGVKGRIDIIKAEEL